MTDANVSTGGSSSRGWWVFLVFVFVVHVGAIFWLSDRSPLRPRQPQFAPTLRLSGDEDKTGELVELLELRDPTVFALPRRRGFSALAWSRTPQPVLRTPQWSEAPLWLEPRAESLGIGFVSVPLTNLSLTGVTPSMPEPEVLVPGVARVRLDEASRLTLVCDEPAVTLATPIALPSWPARVTGPADVELLTNSVVQVMLDALGKPVSVALLSSSGSGPADDYAVREAAKARFEVAPPPAAKTASSAPLLAGLRWCQLVFEWHTVPATNAPARQP